MSETKTRPQLVQPGEIAKIKSAGREVASKVGGDTVSKFFELNKDAIAAVLPEHMRPDRMVKIALRCLRTTPKLLNCTVSSLFGAVITCAQLGLEPNTPQGHIYLIPFENKKKGIYEVQVIVGYKGLIDLARRSGEIVSISSHPVFKGDPFEIMFGTEEKIVHRPNLEGIRGDIIGFYSVAKLTDGGTQLEFMTAAEVNIIRDGSQGYRTAVRYAKNGEKPNTPWATSYQEMGRKTVIRRLCKYLPMSIELANAVALDERGDLNLTQGLDRVIDGEFTITEDEEEAEEGALSASEMPDDLPGKKDGMPETQEGDPGAGVEQQSTAKTEPDHDPETGEVQGANAKPATETKPTEKAASKSAVKGKPASAPKDFF